MKGELSWLVLVVAFLMVTGLCGILAVRLGRVGSAGERGSGGETHAADPVTRAGS